MITAILLASGSGIRFGGDVPKQFVKLAGKTILEHTLEVFDSHEAIDNIVIVSHPDWTAQCQEYASRCSKRALVVSGGNTRMDSSYAGIAAVPEGTTHVLIHDAVRPFIRHETLRSTIAALAAHQAVDTVIPTADTIVEVFENMIQDIPDRSRLRRGQTPQGFELNLIRRAHEQARRDRVASSTDDCRLVRRLGVPVFCVAGSLDNIKITEEFDLFTAERYFQIRKIGLDVRHKRFSGAAAVVVGGRTGIGRATLEAFEKAGLKPIALSRETDPALDVTDEDNVREALATVYGAHGPFQVVVNSAGFLERGYVRALSIETMLNMVETNLSGTIRVCKHALPFMAKGGHIVNIVSSSATRGRATYAAYSASKAAVVNFTQALAEEVPELHVNAVCPQRTATEMRFKAFGFEDPLSLLSPQTVAEDILSVVSSDFTGQVIDVRIEQGPRNVRKKEDRF